MKRFAENLWLQKQRPLLVCRWVKDGVFETLLQGSRTICRRTWPRFHFYECFVDGTFYKAKGGGDGIGCTKADKGVKIMILVDAKGLSMAVTNSSASPHESGLIQELFGFLLTKEKPALVIGDKDYDRDFLDAEMAIPWHRNDRAQPFQPHSNPRRSPLAPIPPALDRGTHDRLAPKLCIRWEKSQLAFQGFLHLACALLLMREVLGWVLVWGCVANQSLSPFDYTSAARLFHP